MVYMLSNADYISGGCYKRLIDCHESTWAIMVECEVSCQQHAPYTSLYLFVIATYSSKINTNRLSGRSTLACKKTKLKNHILDPGKKNVKSSTKSNNIKKIPPTHSLPVTTNTQPSLFPFQRDPRANPANLLGGFVLGLVLPLLASGGGERVRGPGGVARRSGLLAVRVRRHVRALLSVPVHVLLAVGVVVVLGNDEGKTQNGEFSDTVNAH